MTQDIDRIVARFAAPPVTEVGEDARDLMHEIMASEPTPGKARRRPRRRVAIPAGALLTAAVVAVTWLLPASYAAALDIRQEGGYYVIQIKDLYAAPETYEEQLRSVGLDVSLIVVPASAAFEGQVFPTAPDLNYITDIKGIYPPGPCDKLDGCAIGVKIPVGFKGTARIEVGRKAKPGERYHGFTSWDVKGEPLHCVPYRNKTVAEVRTMLRERGVDIEEFMVFDPTDIKAGYELRKSVPDRWFVSGGSLHSSELAVVYAHAKATPQKSIDRRNQANGCPTS
ncbi:hypothetical protein [Nonomuraea zeae]|uniref:Uncharacterized protein n=1 Tax=Nonomuraea zeae TaxID=1642303 RepID=A0A5S4FLS0_9ACTN|nr:hypothetical protein [Nonomuraea zeae]TMR21676.1 hypothetical protein ETD85_50595 [Nonomuraea zeae]